MHCSAHYALLVPLLVSAVTAQTIALGKGPGFDPPPLQKANLAFYSIFAIASLVQLGIATSYIFRGRSPHLLPGVGAVLAFLFLFISSALDVGYTIARFTYDDFGNIAFSEQAILDLEIGSLLCNNWVDPLVFFTAAMVLRDRYITHTRYATSPPTRTRTIPIVPFTLASCLLSLALFLTTTIGTAVWGALYTSLYSFEITSDTFNQKIKVVDQYEHAYVGLDAIASIFLLVFANIVRKQAKGDKITSLTMLAIVPLFCLHALARVIYEILNARLPLKGSFTSTTADALDLSDTVVYRTLFFVLACVLSYFVLYPQLWNGPGELHTSQHSSNVRYDYNMQSPASTRSPSRWNFTGPPLPQRHPDPNGPSQGLFAYRPREVPIPSQETTIPPTERVASLHGEEKASQGPGSIRSSPDKAPS